MESCETLHKNFVLGAAATFVSPLLLSSGLFLLLKISQDVHAVNACYMNKLMRTIKLLPMLSNHYNASFRRVPSLVCLVLQGNAQ